MDRSILHGAPSKGTPPSARASQDARSNLAIQPSANAGSVKLKKNAVKIIGAAGPMPKVNPQVSAPVSQMPFFPVLSPVKPEETDRHKAANLNAMLVVPAVPTPLKVDISEQSNPTEATIDSMFARLTTQNSTIPPRTTGATSFLGPDMAMFSFEDRSGAMETSNGIVQSSVATIHAPVVGPKKTNPVNTRTLANIETDQTKTVDLDAKAEDMKPTEDVSHEDLENEYLRKASEYIHALPDSKGTTAYTFKVVAKKLHTSYVPDIKLDPESNEKLKARYVFAVINYVNQVVKSGTKRLTADSVKQILEDNDGDFLSLCVTLVEEKYLALDNINELTDLCNAILDILPKSEPTIKTPIRCATPVMTTSIVEAPRAASGSSVDNMKAWPTQEKRDNAASYRTCILKGVKGVASINQLQALVWGGRLEAICMPETGADFAVVKFLTAEACQKYFEDTENGIEIAGDKKAVVFVERTAAPKSVNDVIRNCIEGNASRCVRAVGVDEDWSDLALMTIARGKSQVKRDVDRIKRGKTPRGYPFVEFRFANIYHALSLRRQLMDDEDWEKCTISYAPDPCEIARGVHYKDGDESESGLTA
ncbi:hypothetical protein BKA66DRAFT_422782 [Pyrenochaeta sp. MPI-SDFR-AT-0127]|nr:hypothetical protein BKA66DRAFT_422782 [Pyrenochaeta sp. MPI-SDFR-AT-0127]